jgi:hypothetical protein
VRGQAGKTVDEVRSGSVANDNGRKLT